MGDGFYRSKDPTNSIKVLKELMYRWCNIISDSKISQFSSAAHVTIQHIFGDWVIKHTYTESIRME